MQTRAQELYRWGYQMVFDGNSIGESLVDYANAWKAEVGNAPGKEQVVGAEVKEMLTQLAKSSHPDTLSKILGVDWGPRAAEKALARIVDLEREIADLRALVERKPLNPKSAEVQEAIKLVPTYKSPHDYFLAGLRFAEFQHNIRARRAL